MRHQSHSEECRILCMKSVHECARGLGQVFAPEERRTTDARVRSVMTKNNQRGTSTRRAYRGGATDARLYYIPCEVLSLVRSISRTRQSVCQSISKCYHNRRQIRMLMRESMNIRGMFARGSGNEKAVAGLDDECNSVSNRRSRRGRHGPDDACVCDCYATADSAMLTAARTR